MAHFTAVLDEDNHRYIISPLKPGSRMDVPTIFRTIMKTTNTGWNKLAKFAGLKNSSAAFGIAYCNHTKSKLASMDLPLGSKSYTDMLQLRKFVTIDVAGQCAYFYDVDHQPEEVVVPHVGPTIENGEDAIQNIVERVPTKITTRVLIRDEIDQRRLKLTLTPINGYLISNNDINFCNAGVSYAIDGSRSALNKFLRQVYFVGISQGEGQVVIQVDDGAGEVSSVISTEVKVMIAAGNQVSVPKLALPSTPSVVLNDINDLPTTTVEDTDGKVMTLKITPFGCNLINFKNFLGYVSPGHMRVIEGRPETINADIANMQVIPTQVGACIGFVLECGKTVIKDYISLDVQDESAEDPTPEVAEEPVASTSMAEPEPVQEPEPIPASLLVENTALTCAATDNVGLGAIIDGTDTDSHTLVIHPVNCTVIGLPKGKTVATGSRTTFTGTIATLNTKIADAKVVASTSTGTVELTLDGTVTTITVEVPEVATTAVEPEAEPEA